ncbi:hypothetical protein [Serratia fonticola]|uniref:Uncharacterized protein n=1 Tax=Serratia fonticola TaxID=47917 RepID=A0AAW3WSR6_SERFO|nr:hypothetical protein [Serratia fonticola]MBC3213566.1 hypothetical protein [Serratia fonticola]NYA11470.1 hypothetical protein [Serratia fonticola]NYA31374.1 hypothetical protein [Serratia fonticola]
MSKKSIADLIKSVEIHVQAHREAAEAEMVDKPHQDIEKSAQDALAALIERNKDLLNDDDLPEDKGRKVKSRGIALCHVDQGYSANQRPVSLLTKSKSRMVKVEICKAGITVLTPSQEANLKGILATLKMKGTN